MRFLLHGAGVLFVLACFHACHAAKPSKAAPSKVKSSQRAEHSDTCDAHSTRPGCSKNERSNGSQAKFRALRHFVANAGGVFPRQSLEFRSVQDQIGVFTRKAVKKGDVLMEVPLSHVIWRESMDLLSLGIDLPPGTLLSEAERLILFIAVLWRRAALNLDAGFFGRYAETLFERSLSNSTLFWSITELDLLKNTDAYDLTMHFLSRVAHIHSAAPSAATLDEIKFAFAHYHLHHFRLWLGGAPFAADRLDIALVPGLDMCRHREGGARAVFHADRRAVQLIASERLQAGEEIFVDFGTRDFTDYLISGSVFKYELDEATRAGVFLPVPLDADVNGRMKGELLEVLRWPAEVRLIPNGTQEMHVLRLAVMPPEEFSAWSVSAMASGTPLAVSRAFRTEVQAMAFLASDCAQRASAVSSFTISASAPQVESTAYRESRYSIAAFYRTFVADVYSNCAGRAKDKLGRLRKWAQRQPSWTQSYVDEAIWRTTSESKSSRDRRDGRLLAMEPPSHVDATDIDQRLSYSSIVALVNSKAREFLPYFTQLLQAPVVTVRGFIGIRQRLMKIKRLAASIVQLKGPACGAVDLSAFDWINELQDEQEVFTTLRYLLPEMDGLVQEFAELGHQGEPGPVWR